MIRNIVNSIVLCVAVLFAISTYGNELQVDQAPQIEEVPTAEVEVPTAEAQVPTAEVEVPTALVDVPTAEVNEPVEEKAEIEEKLEARLLRLDAELQLLEEDLLYPASSRVAVYLSMDLGELFALDAVTVKLNGKDVTHHLYTEREVDALYRGGVQKLFVGNAKQGKNRLTAFFIGEGPFEREYKRAATVSFEQSFEPVFIELSITDDMGSQQPEFVAAVF